MVNGLPQSKAADIFNKLADIAMDDAASARPLIRELSSLDRQLPGNFTTKVSLAHANLIAGNRQAAIEQMHAAWILRDFTSYAALDRLMLMLLLTGDTARALESAKSLAFDKEAQAAGLAMDNYVQVAVASFDWEFLKALAERSHGAAQDVINFLGERESWDIFRIHQQIAYSIVRSHQLAGTFTLDRDDDGCFIGINSFLLDGSADRRKLENDIYDAIEEKLGDKVNGLIFNVLTKSSAKIGLTPLSVSG